MTTRHVQTNFRASDFESGGEAKATKKSAAKKAAPAPKQSGDEVPEGTTAEVLDWVGDDVNKAKKALSAEKKSDDPRVTLVEPLEKMIEDDKEAKKAAAAEKKAAKENKDTE